MDLTSIDYQNINFVICNLKMIKPLILLLLTVTALALTLHSCPSGSVYIIPLKKCEPFSKLCLPNQFYNNKTKTCDAKSLLCKTGQYFDTKTNKCANVSTKCPKGQTFNKKLQACHVPLKCKPGYFVNPKYQVCVKKSVNCSTGQYFDYITKKCMTATFVTSPYEKNLIYSGSFKTYVKNYLALKKATPNLKNCPISTPYYESSTLTCISCPSKTPYFDLSASKCVKCSFSQYYNAFMHKCVSQNLIPKYPSTISRIGY